MTSWRCFPFFAACALLAFAACSGGVPSRAGPQGDDNVVALTSRETLNAARTLVKVQSCTERHPADGTITGSGTGGIAKCHTFGPVTGQRDLQYHLDTLSGAATTNLLKNRGKFLEQLH